MLRYLHGIENIKDRVYRFFKYIFLAEEKGQLKFYDGHKLLKFSARPTIAKKNQWDFRTLPCLLISMSDGELLTLSFEKDFLGNTSTYLIQTDDYPGPSGTDFYESGGDINLTITVDVYAYTAEERDKLLDIISVYLSGPTAKDYFMRYYIKLPTNIRTSEGGTVNLPNIDTPVYYSTISFSAVGTWRDREYMGPRLSEILYDLEFKQSLDFYLDHAVATDYRTVRLVFSEDLADNVNLYNIDHYTFACPTVITASEITRVDARTIDITIDGEMQDGGSYLIKVTDIQNSDGKTIEVDNGKAVFRGVGTLPQLISTTLQDITTLLLTFDREMKDDVELINENNYVFSGPSSIYATTITRIDAYNVEVTISGEMLDGGNYSIKVSDITDSIGSHIDPNYSTGIFTGIGIAPRLLSAISIDATTIRALFNEAMSNSGLTTATNYAFTCPAGATISAASVTKINSTTVDISITGEMQTGTDNYTAVVSNVTDAVGNTIDPIYNSDTFNGIGIAPQVVSSVSLDYATIRVEFDSDMGDTGLTTIGNYNFTCPVGASISASSVIRTIGTLDSVDITISGEMLTGTDNYTIEVSGVEDVAGNVIDPAHDSDTFNGIGMAPQVASVTAITDSIIEIIFNENMSDDGLITGTNYVFTCPPAAPITVFLVTKINATTVRISSTGEMLTGTDNYTLTISNVKDAIGNVIDPAHNSDTFNGIGIAPQVSSATSISSTLIDIAFNEAMNDTGLTTPGNYTFTCPVGGEISPLSVTKITSSLVEILISGEMITGTNNYSVEVSNVTDTVGNVIDPAHDSDTFNGIGIAPQVSSATSTAIDTVRVVFNENMSDTGLTTVGNYAFTCPPGATITVSLVTKINATTVDITSSGEMLTGTDNYTVVVSNVTDQLGNPIDPAHNSDTFNGIGIAPQVLSASFVDADTCTVTFDSSMDITSAQVPGNYVLSGPSSPVVSTATLVGNTVTLDLATNMLNGDYTVTVSNVTDLVGNVIDPAHNSGTYTAVVSYPYIIVFGGYDGIRKNDTWAWDGTSWVQKTPVTNPSIRYQHSMSYDSSINSLILFGGNSGALLNDTWEYAGIDWVQRFPATSPAQRYAHCSVYDISHNATVLFGGITGAGRNDETWEYNSTTVSWVQKASGAVTKPTARAKHNMAYDSNRGVTVLFGGETAMGRSDETWEWDGTTWVQKASGAVTKPTARWYHSMAYDSFRGVTVLFGGWAGSLSQETWEWDGSTWVQRATGVVTKPSSRQEHKMAYDPYRKVGVLYGGAAPGFNDETWEWDGTTWVQKASGAVPKPSARQDYGIGILWS